MSKANEITLDVALGGLSIGKKTTRLGITVPIEDLDLEEVVRFFHFTQLAVRIDPGDVEKDQTLIEGLEPKPLEATVTSKGVSIGSTHYSIGLTFHRNTVKTSDLDAIAFRSARLKVTRTGTAEDDGEE